MKILAAHPSNDLYGSDRMLLRTLAAYTHAGHEVVLVLPSWGVLADAAVELNCKVEVLATPVLQKRLLRPLRFMRFLCDVSTSTVSATRFIRRLRPSVIYINTITLPVWVFAARVCGASTTVHVREAEQTSRWIRKALLSPLTLVNDVIANSRATASNIVSVYPRLRKRVLVIYNGIDFPASAPRTHDRGSVFQIVLVGRLSPRKGQDVAIDAISRLVRSGRDVRLRIVGDCYPGYEWYRKELEALIVRLELNAIVDLQGFSPNVWPYYRSADAALVPSRAEPFGNVAIEAMAAGTPVVVASVQGLEEIVVDGDNGLVFPSEDGAALASCLEFLMDSPDRLKQMARRAESDARDRFGFDRYASQMVTMIETVGK